MAAKLIRILPNAQLYDQPVSIPLERALRRDMPIRWTDEAGVIHACTGSEVHPGVSLIWTVCQQDVPANAAEARSLSVTCPNCREGWGAGPAMAGERHNWRSGSGFVLVGRDGRTQGTWNEIDCSLFGLCSSTPCDELRASNARDALFF